MADEKKLTELKDLVEGALITYGRRAAGVEVVEEVYYVDGQVTAGTFIFSKPVAWSAEVSIRVDQMPYEIGEVQYRSARGNEDWHKTGGSPPEAIKRKGAALREHIVGIRDAGRFATKEQLYDMMISLKAIVTAAQFGDPDELADGVTRAEELLSQVYPDVAVTDPTPGMR